MKSRSQVGYGLISNRTSAQIKTLRPCFLALSTTRSYQSIMFFCFGVFFSSANCILMIWVLEYDFVQQIPGYIINVSWFSWEWAYVGQSLCCKGWASPIPFTLINLTNQRTNPWNFCEKKIEDWGTWGTWKSQFFELARMGRNFDDYRDFQPRIRCAYTFALQCTYVWFWITKVKSFSIKTLAEIIRPNRNTAFPNFCWIAICIHPHVPNFSEKFVKYKVGY